MNCNRSSSVPRQALLETFICTVSSFPFFFSLKLSVDSMISYLRKAHNYIFTNTIAF